MPNRQAKVQVNKRSLDNQVKRLLNGKVDKRSKAYREFKVVADLVIAEASRLARQRISKRKGSTGAYIRALKADTTSDGDLAVVNNVRAANGRYYARDLEKGIGEAAGKAPIVAKKTFMVIPVANLTSVNYRRQKSGSLKSRKGKANSGRSNNPKDESVIFVKRVKGYRGLHIMEDAAKNVARKYGYKFNNFK